MTAPASARRIDVLLLILLVRAGARAASHLGDRPSLHSRRRQHRRFRCRRPSRSRPAIVHLPLRGENHPALPAYVVKASSTLFGTSPLGYRVAARPAGLLHHRADLSPRRASGTARWPARWAAALLAFNEYYLDVSSRATAHVPHLLFVTAARVRVQPIPRPERAGLSVRRRRRGWPGVLLQGARGAAACRCSCSRCCLPRTGGGCAVRTRISRARSSRSLDQLRTRSGICGRIPTATGDLRQPRARPRPPTRAICGGSAASAFRRTRRCSTRASRCSRLYVAGHRRRVERRDPGVSVDESGDWRAAAWRRPASRPSVRAGADQLRDFLLLVFWGIVRLLYPHSPRTTRRAGSTL